jgi:hypothetical protein
MREIVAGHRIRREEPSFRVTFCRSSSTSLGKRYPPDPNWLFWCGHVVALRSGLHIDLDGGALHLWYPNASEWISELTAGEAAPVLVREGSAQALRDPEGHVLYSEDSALHKGYSDIAGAVFMSGTALLITVIAFVLSPWFQQRPRDVALAVVLADAGVSGAVSGAVIQRANSLATGVTIGVILFCLLGIAAPVVLRLGWPRMLAAHDR